MSDPLKPSATVLIKLGSIAVHVEEMIETKFKNVDFDLPPVKADLSDPEVRAWIKDMGVFLPLKRS